MKKTVVFDFDGVIHSYKSGWQGETVIPDEPVPEIKDAIDDIRSAGYEVVVVSTRCATPAGLQAVKDYLTLHEIVVDRVCKEKPPAIVYIDDRAICFDGRTDNLLEKINNFSPWYEKGDSQEPIIENFCIEATVERKKNFDKMVDNLVLGEIREIATDYGILKKIILNEKAIVEALTEYAQKHYRGAE